jgi:hypothetical protein
VQEPILLPNFFHNTSTIEVIKMKKTNPYRVKITHFAFILSVMRSTYENNPVRVYKKLRLKRFKVLEILDFAFGVEDVEPIIEYIKKPKSILHEQTETGDQRIISLTDEQMSLLLLLTFLAHMTFNEIAIFLNFSIGSADDVRLRLKALSSEKLISFASDPTSLKTLCDIKQARPNYSDFEYSLNHFLWAEAYCELDVLLIESGVKLKQLFIKYRNLWDNCQRRRSKRLKLLKMLREGTLIMREDSTWKIKQDDGSWIIENPTSLDQNKLRKSQGKFLLNPIDFLMVILEAFIKNNDLSLSQILNHHCSRFEDKGHYISGNFLLWTKSKNSTFNWLNNLTKTSNKNKRILAELRLEFEDCKLMLTDLYNHTELLIRALEEMASVHQYRK